MELILKKKRGIAEKTGLKELREQESRFLRPGRTRRLFTETVYWDSTSAALRGEGEEE